jgi:hypothetical protein
VQNQIMSNPLKPTAAELAREALYFCQPDGFTAYPFNRAPSAEELALIGWVPVQFKAVKLRPYVCPVNGAEFGDEPYYKRLPHRPDGTRLRFG